MVYALGVDIGGTKIAAVIINQHNEILYRTEVQSKTADKETMFEQVVICIENVLSKAKLQISEMEGIGVGVPGKIDQENGIAIYQSNLPWANFPIVDRLKDYFSIEKVAIDNDVYMAAFAEWKVSKLLEKDTFVYLTISTGISCSIIHNGAFLRGAGFAGEIGLVPVRSAFAPNGLSAMEKAASGPSIEALARGKFDQKDITVKEVFQRYQAGDPTCQSIMDEVVKSLAHGIYAVLCLIDPHKVIFGGGVMNNNPYLLELVKDELKDYLIPEQIPVLDRMYTSHFKGDAGTIGAGLRGIMLKGERKVTF